MKTYDQRVKDILKKAKRRKIVGACLKTVASTLCLVAIIVGLMHIPYRSSHVGVNPTSPTNGPTVTNPPTMTTVPTLPTVPTVPTVPTIPTVPTVPTEPTEPNPGTYEDFVFHDLHMDGERVKLIEETWAQKTWFGFSEYIKFCDPASGLDGIRYYGSFTREQYDGQIVTYDILYIPCKTLPVASELTFAGHTFRSWNGFGLYVFYSKYMSILDDTMNVFGPLSGYLEEGSGASLIEDEVLLKAAQMHDAYETMLYGSALTEMPQENPADDLLRLKATWLLQMGYVPTFGEESGERYYGTFSGYEIVFMETAMMMVQTQTIGGEDFSHSSSFTLYAIKDWQLYLLRDVYDEGLISQENIVQLAQIHREPIDLDAELEKFNTLFGDLDSWYNRAIVSQYSDPTQIDLKLLFYVGFEGESQDPTDEEWEQLKDQRGFHEYMDLIRLPVDKMNQVLMDLFGITLEDVDDAGFENLVYLESTNCYYHMVTDFECVDDFNAISMETNHDGSVCVYYTANWDDTVYAVTLMLTDDGYRIISNVKVE